MAQRPITTTHHRKIICGLFIQIVRTTNPKNLTLRSVGVPPLHIESMHRSVDEHIHKFFEALDPNNFMVLGIINDETKNQREYRKRAEKKRKARQETAQAVEHPTTRHEPRFVPKKVQFVAEWNTQRLSGWCGHCKSPVHDEFNLAHTEYFAWTPRFVHYVLNGKITKPADKYLAILYQ